MKKILIALIISIFFVNFVTVNAQTEIIIDYELNANDEVLTNFREKKTYASQKYENTSSITVLNNPCKECNIMVRIWNSKKDFSAASITQMGNTSYIGRTTHSVPGNHRLKIKRSDFTLLKTSHVASWYID